MWDIFFSEISIFVLVFLGIFLFCFFAVKPKKLRNRILFVWIIIFAIAAVVLGCNGYGIKYHNIQTADSKTFSQQELLEDFLVLENNICKRNPLAFADRDNVAALFEQARKKIEADMTEEEFFRIVNPIVVAAKCGHTNLSVSKALIENRKDQAVFFPVEVIIENRDIVASGSNQMFGIESGDRILSINGNSADDIVSCFEKNISHDGDNYAVARYIAGKHFGYEYYEFIEKPKIFYIILSDSHGKQYSLAVEGEYIDKENTAAWQLHREEFSGIDYYYYQINDVNAILTVRVFFEGTEKFGDFLADFFEQAKEQDVQNLLIDVSGNFGGSPQMAKELLSYLVKKETPFFSKNTDLPLWHKIRGVDENILPKENRFSGSVTLKVDGGCFSTSGHFASVFKTNHLGNVIGSPTGGGAACTDGAKNVTLRNTGIRLHVSRVYYEVVADASMRNIVIPD